MHKIYWVLTLSVHGRGSLGSGGAHAVEGQGTVFGAPRRATSVGIAVIWVGVIPATSHVIYHRICVHAHTSFSACLDRFSQLITAAHSSLETVGNRLVGKVPGIEVVAERFQTHDLLLNGEKLDAHVTHFGKHGAFLLHLGVWPHEHFHDSSFL